MFNMKQSLGQCHHLRHIQVVFSRAAIFRCLAGSPVLTPFSTLTDQICTFQLPTN